MTIKMIVDECDKYELPDITDTFSFNFSTADSWVKSRIVSGREVGVGNVIKPNKSMSFLPLSTYTLNIIDLGEGVCWGPNILIPAGSTIVQNTF
jgi:hypothetical protein